MPEKIEIWFQVLKKSHMWNFNISISFAIVSKLNEIQTLIQNICEATNIPKIKLLAKKYLFLNRLKMFDPKYEMRLSLNYDLTCQ